MLKKILGVITLIVSVNTIFAQDAYIRGQVKSNGEGVPFVNVMVEGTNMGVSTDESGKYQLENLPKGKYTIKAQAVGYKGAISRVDIENEKPIILDFNLQPDVLQLEQVVVTANRDEVNRRDAPIIVNTLNTKQLGAVSANTLSEGLNFLPGLRTENNCQNCGFTQLRMNGMEGAYSQILINGRPIFSGLAGVYGLEILPSGMIERLEVIRGGGSALYGSNAIAGTVNVITKDPINNSYAVKVSNQIVGAVKGSNPTNDLMVNFNNSIIGNNARNGLALYGFVRNRAHYDANKDGFSELPELQNFTIGGRFYRRLGLKGKITTDLYAINSTNRGGNAFDLPYHETDITEAVEHEIYSGSFTFERFFRERDMLSAFISAQHINRDAYYGAEKALDAYGNTTDLTWIGGLQYNAYIGKLNLVSGIENTNGSLRDVKLAYREWDTETAEYIHYPNTVVADQFINTSGLFLQGDYRLGKLKASAGARFDHYMIRDNYRSENDDVTGNVISPRINFLYNFHEHIQARISYSQGYRAPQIFDEDLHIETSGARQIHHVNSPDLSQESSHSATASLDFHPHFGENTIEFTAEGFYTRLIDPFANEFGIPDESSTVIYTRVNANGYAEVYGMNLEMNWFYSDIFNLSSGFTMQRSMFNETQEFDTKRFFRTPDNYGYLTAQIIPADRWRISITENYTGKMLIPYFGNTLDNPELGELRETNIFFDTGLKVCYEVSRKKLDFNFFAGVKNIFNSYQNDFDLGIDRDPAYVYGPLLPRTIYFGIKIGQFK